MPDSDRWVCRLIPQQRLPNTPNISFSYIEGESLLLNIDIKGGSRFRPVRPVSPDLWSPPT